MKTLRNARKGVWKKVFKKKKVKLGGPPFLKRKKGGNVVLRRVRKRITPVELGEQGLTIPVKTGGGGA